jgi:hypothetical protein
LSPSDFDHTAAPKNGMKTGALAWMPSRRSWMTWPISCTNSSTTKPTANFQPQIRLYAATDTSIDPDVVRTLSFGSRKRTAFSFAPSFTARTASAATAPPARFHQGLRSSPKGSSERSGSGESSGSRGARKSSALGASGRGGSHRLVSRCSVIGIGSLLTVWQLRISRR